jgi:hypothetical protein
MRQGIQLLLPPNLRFPLIRTALKGVDGLAFPALVPTHCVNSWGCGRHASSAALDWHPGFPPALRYRGSLPQEFGDRVPSFESTGFRLGFWFRIWFWHDCARCAPSLGCIRLTLVSVELLLEIGLGIGGSTECV